MANVSHHRFRNRSDSYLKAIFRERGGTQDTTSVGASSMGSSHFKHHHHHQHNGDAGSIRERFKEGI